MVLTKLRSSAAELLAFSVLELFPEITLVEGKATEFGFYYDFLTDQPINAQAISLIEEKMRGIAKEGREVRFLDMMRENAASLFEHKGQFVKANLVSQSPENIVTIVQIDHFYDFCANAEVLETTDVGFFKIIKIEPVQRKFGEEGILDVVRIRGVVFPDKALLKKHIKSLSAAKKVDHREIGQEMKLFKQIKELSSTWTWLENGVNLKDALYDLWKRMCRECHFHLVSTPVLLNKSIVQTYGVYDFPAEKEDRALSYSFAPAHAIYYGLEPRAQVDLPLRVAQCGAVDLIQADQLWGMLNNTLVYTDSAHIFCAPSQLEEELISSLQFIDKFIKIFGFEYHWYLCGRGQSSLGSSHHWDKGEEALVQAFTSAKIPFSQGDTPALVGPAAEAWLVDSVGRQWRGPCLNLDFQAPKRFALRYKAQDGRLHTPMMLACSLFGSFERFSAVLVEHFAGQLPVWLAPNQVRVIPVAQTHVAYADQVYKAIEACGFRVSIDCREGQLGSKVHSAKSENVPYLIIIGDKEEKQKLITVRSCCEMVGVQTNLETFLTQLREEVQIKSLPRKSGSAKLRSEKSA